MHVRAQIRSEIAAALAMPGVAVYVDKIYPLDKGTLPAIIISATGESVERLTSGRPALQAREISVEIEVIASAVAGVSGILDQICSDIEVAISTMATIAGDVQYRNTDIDITADGERPVGMAVISYTFLISTLEDNPDLAL